jgi:hypothetical protein
VGQHLPDRGQAATPTSVATMAAVPTSRRRGVAPLAITCRIAARRPVPTSRRQDAAPLAVTCRIAAKRRMFTDAAIPCRIAANV